MFCFGGGAVQRVAKVLPGKHEQDLLGPHPVVVSNLAVICNLAESRQLQIGESESVLFGKPHEGGC